MMTSPLRVCRVCGLESWTENDLKKFCKNYECKYGRDSFCKKCHNERRRITRKHSNIKNKNTILFKDKQIVLKRNPRTDICSSCGLKYPEELGAQTCVHHWTYHLFEPLAYSQEFCQRCHAFLEATIRKIMDDGFLRTCRICGLTANSEEELNMFAKNPNSRYERDQICMVCRKKIRILQKKT